MLESWLVLQTVEQDGWLACFLSLVRQFAVNPAFVF
jgi:hypothetical protein